ncbi:MAG TPA: BTAD domain-containing putative transcriptional regulator [Candidatus Limnocylindrales bacterium]|nr:BTAD domain-containing putative transcriptional regulator [Candidatus Limnocylindrales bacterium]
MSTHRRLHRTRHDKLGLEPSTTVCRHEAPEPEVALPSATGAVDLAVDLRVLGPVEAFADGRPVNLGPRKQRLMLAVLALEANQVVPIDRLVELMWPESPPRTAVHAVQVCASRLRAVLASRLELVGHGGGYMLRADPLLIDVHRFLSLVEQARTAGDDRARMCLLDNALALWAGPALSGSAPPELSDRLCRGLEEARLAAVEDRLAVRLRLGGHRDALAELTALVAAYPRRGRPVELLMLALYRDGRAADALGVYQQARQVLADELGLDPGPELQRLEIAILRGDPSLDLPETGVPPELSDDDQASVAIAVPEAARPALLPPAVAGFVGRDDHLAELDDALAEHEPSGPDSSITVISGTAGVGKTSLAVSWAHRVAATFPDGQLYVNLRGYDPSHAPLDPDEVVRGFLDALGVPPERIPATPAGRVDLYRSRLAGTRTLVVLDNAVGPEQVRPLLPGAPSCLVLVTSRDQLTSLMAVEGARSVSLDVLSRGEAKHLLRLRLGRHRVAAEPDAVREIIDLSARLPLALAIVAARAANRRNVALAEVARELRASHHALNSFHAGDPATDLRAVFSWSYRTLGTETARLFRLLGLHPGPDVGLAAMASLAGQSPGRTRRLVADLTAAHLLTERGAGRYACHDLLRAYAAELAHQSDPPEFRKGALRRLVDHYLHSAYTAAGALDLYRDGLVLDPPANGVRPESPDGHEAALAWLVGEHPILVEMVELAADGGFEGHAWRLAITLTEYFERRGHWHDWAATHLAAHYAAERLGDQRALAHTHRGLGRAQLWLGHYDDADVQYRGALELFGKLGDRLGQARTWHSLGRVAELRGRYAEALAHTAKGLELFRVVGDRAGLAKALNGVGWYHTLLGNHRLALADCGEALAILQDLGDRRVEANTWDSLGYAHHQLGDQTAAITCYEHALDLFRAVGDWFHEADVSDHLGDAWVAAGDPVSAARAWQRAVAVLEQLGHADAARVRAKVSSLLSADEPAMIGR